MRKVSVVGGGGNVGASAGLYLAERGICDVVMVDIAEGVPQGKALDLAEARSVRGYDSSIIGTNDYSDITDSDVVVVTAGFPRKPGMSRTDLLLKNAEIVSSVAGNIKKYAPNAYVVVVSNPLDMMTYHMMKETGFDPKRVMGMAGVLDATRFRCFIADELGVAATDVQAMVLGGHGDSMVPLPRYATVSGVPITDLLDAETIDRLVKRTAVGGGEIVKLMGTSAFYAPAASAAQMAEAILLDNKRMLPAAAFCTGQYGIRDVYVGVPIILGANGVEKIVELPLSDAELDMLRTSAGEVAEGIKELP
ncbi:MAG: malate dehydrogenase [Candidatus Eisenbacteria bacterium]|uniref:Malate dehydrogenase n=1 Tax=Eiseniibacteriota bacterium TaxID=2212470 RepID=A0A7Y2H2S7_UNCEI|nr:malate dehydrogenase [Candidatus Eisenbacteria bacterium]